jgi:hypothetical protein
MVERVGGMNRSLFFAVLGVVSLLFTAFAARQFFFACTAGSALVGVPSAVGAQHHYSVLSIVWLAAGIVGVIGLIACLLAAKRHSSISSGRGTPTMLMCSDRYSRSL